MSATATEAPVKIRQTKLLINGEWVDSASGKTFDNLNPATGEVVARVAEGGKEDIDRAVLAARRAFDDGPWRTKFSSRKRGELLYKLADLIEKNADELAALETLDNGKPISETRYADLPLVVQCFRYYASLADKIHGEVIPVEGKPGTMFCYTLREPIGVIGQIIPWNFPLLMAAWKLGPALAAGNTMVLKPAEQTPLTALRLGELITEAGFPPGVVNIVNGFGETAGDALVKHPGVDKIAFTGEYKTAQIIMANAAQTLKRVSFELGGKSPNIVFADADLDQAVKGAMAGIFFNQGEVCCAGSRLLVEESAHDAFVEKFAAAANARKLGDPFDPKTEQGAQVSKEQFDRIMSYIEIGKKEAQCVAGGERFGDKGYFIKPTIFTGVDNKMRIAQEEIFGPVVAVQKFKNPQEVTRVANDTIFGLAAAVWTRDISKAHRIANEVRAGTVWINCYNTFDSAAPFGGYKYSGMGRELGVDSVYAYTEVKTVWTNLR
ncbi:MAG: NADP/NAD-dependent aldehyde dehydrogenase PuuC [Phycisphaerae bacterium]|nr:NADP/NAD-dependent aldehyde dehydrogenase PuuC [Phycisphaerae bacterium]